MNESSNIKILWQDDAHRCTIWMIEKFFDYQSSNKYLSLFQSYEYNEEPGMFGRPCLRKTCSYGAYETNNGEEIHDREVLYPYFKKVDVAKPWTEDTRKIRDAVWEAYKRHMKKRKRDQEEKEEEHAKRPNYCLLNLYPNKNSGIGWHADDEKVIVKHSPIFSVSFGAARVFAIKQKNSDQACAQWLLASGSLLVMDGHTQDFYKHSILKSGGEHGLRINLTFRAITDRL